MGYEIYHHGIKGQKWGVRRYENEDGTRTEAGKKRYNWFAQRKDKKMFSKGAVKRIKEKVDNGESIESARGAEVERLHKTRSKAFMIGALGLAAGAIAGARLGQIAPDILQKGALSLSSVDKFQSISNKQYLLHTNGVRKALLAGGIIAGSSVGYKAARNTTMRISGYKAKRFK